VQLLSSALATLTLAYLALCVLVATQESSFIFFPSPYPEGDWSLPASAEELELSTPEGHLLHGWYFRNPEARWTLLYFHGNAGNLTGRRTWCQALAGGLPAEVLIVDYPGYGKSTGPLDEATIYAHAEVAYAHLTEAEGVPPERLVLYGKSLGGGPAAELATRHPAAALVLQSTFTSVPAMGKRMFPFLPVDWLARTRFDNLAKVRELALPKLFLHSRPDEVVPFAMGEALHAAAAEPKRFVPFDGAGHNDLVTLQELAVVGAIRDFLEAHVPPEREAAP